MLRKETGLWNALSEGEASVLFFPISVSRRGESGCDFLVPR